MLNKKIIKNFSTPKLALTYIIGFVFTLHEILLKISFAPSFGNVKFKNLNLFEFYLTLQKILKWLNFTIAYDTKIF